MRGILFIAALVCLFSIGHTAVIFVPDDQPTIQDAINAAAPGDTVIVRPGTYPENIDFLGKAIRVQSETTAEVTIIDGGTPVNPDLGSVVIFKNGEGSDSILVGFTITNGSGTLNSAMTHHDGGGISCWNSSSPKIRGNIIINNTIDGGGGGISCRGNSSPAIRGNIITGNTTGSSDYGGGIMCEDGSPTISNNVISGNTCGSGAGVFCRHGLPVITGNIIEQNTATSYGGGINMMGTTGTLSRNFIELNTSEWGGGGVWCSVSDASAFFGNVITGNMVTNTSNLGGGGIGAFMSWPAMACNVISGNSARVGGGICLTNNGATSIVTNNSVLANSADQGGGIYIYSSSAVITNTIVWDNAAPSGPAIYLSGSNPTISYCDVQGGWSGTGNIDSDPMFVNNTNGDFHLKFGSPCNDGGTNSATGLPSDDFEGDSRIAGGIVDIGADEFHLHLYCTSVVVPGGSVDVTVIGAPGTSPLKLGLGSGVQDPPQSTPFGDLWLRFPIRFRLTMPVIDNDGLSVVSGIIPLNWNPGDQRAFQALAGGNELTNLMLLTVE